MQLLRVLFCAAMLIPAILPAHAAPRAISHGSAAISPVSTLKYSAGQPARHASAVAPATASRSTGTTVPEGEERVYVTDWMQLFGNVIVANNGLAHRVRFASDGKVYFHDFFASGYDVWFEGALNKETGIITIPTHQVVPDVEIYPNTGLTVDLTLEISTFNIQESSMSSDIDFEAESFTLLLKEDGTIVSPDLDLDWENRKYPVLYSQGSVFALCGSIHMVPCTDTVVTPPADITPEKYSYFHRLQEIYPKASLVETVFDGDDVYIAGLCPELPDIWLKGTFNDNRTKLIFKSGQYMGFDQYHHAFSATHPNPEASEDNPEIPNWLADEELVLNVDADGKTFTFDNERLFAVTISGDVSYILYADKLMPYTLSIDKPRRPIITTGDELLWLEADFLPFVQPNVDVNGKYIDTKNLSWRLYYDDELFTFTPDEYMYLAEATDEMPYCYADNWDFIVYDDLMEQCVAIYKTGYKNIGVESVYRLGDEVAVSDRAYFGEAPTTSVSDIQPQSEVVGSEYFDLSGRKVIDPASGLYIRIDRFADGTTAPRKVRIR